MSIKTVTAYLDSIHSAERIVKAAVNLSEKFGAHLTGLYVTPMTPIVFATAAPGGVAAQTYPQSTYQETEAAIHKIFDQQTQPSASTSEWRQINALVSVHGTVANCSQTSDLLIIGADLEDDPDGLAEDRISTIVAASHRPTLVIPTHDEIPPIGERILVGWDGSAECTRAVFGSLPLLQNATSVDLIMINPNNEESHQTLGTDAELINTLARHNVNATLNFSRCRTTEIADELLRVAREKGADLIVMGAYSTGRLHDFFVGSTTRKVMTSSPIPLFMSH